MDLSQVQSPPPKLSNSRMNHKNLPFTISLTAASLFAFGLGDAAAPPAAAVICELPNELTSRPWADTELTASASGESFAHDPAARTWLPVAGAA